MLKKIIKGFALFILLWFLVGVWIDTDFSPLEKITLFFFNVYTLFAFFWLYTKHKENKKIAKSPVKK